VEQDIPSGDTLSLSSRTEQATEWIRLTRDLSRRVGCESAISSSLAQLEILGREAVNVSIVGAPNCGKSTLINGLLDRSLLPASPIPSLMSFSIQAAPAGAAETFTVANASRPLAQLAAAIGAIGDAQAHVAIAVDNDWLRSVSVQIVEKPALDADDDGLTRAISRSLRDSDIVVVTIDAIMPMRRAEVELIRECARNGIPMIGAVMKLSKLAQEERGEVLAYVGKVARQHLEDLLIIGGEPAAIRDALDALVRGTDFAGVRSNQLRHSLLGALGVIADAARSGADAEKKSEAERQAEITQRKRQIDSQNLVWMQIEHQLNLRREAIEERLRSHLAEGQDKVLEILVYDLEKSDDIKAWWERDLPFRMRHELQAQAAGISSAVDRQLSADRQWLQEELHRRFKLPVAIGLEPAAALSGADIHTRELPISDVHGLKVASRVGTAGAVLGAAALLATWHISGALLATSMLAGLGAESWTRRQTSQNRDMVRAELGGVIGQACAHFARDVSAKLKRWYAEVIASVRERHQQWQQAQMQVLQAGTGVDGKPDWDEILREISLLRRRMTATNSA
jgi:hypothetical protein